MTREGKFIARGLYNPGSTIRVRLYRWDDGPLDEAFWSGRLESAIRLRTTLLRLGGETSRPIASSSARATVSPA